MLTYCLVDKRYYVCKKGGINLQMEFVLHLICKFTVDDPFGG